MHRLVFLALSLAALPALSQPVAAPPSAGTLVIMTGSAEVELPNDEAVVSFFYEAQDADLTKAQGLVNQRVGDGTAALKRADPKAQIETSGWTRSNEPARNSGSASPADSRISPPASGIVSSLASGA